MKTKEKIKEYLVEQFYYLSEAMINNNIEQISCIRKEINIAIDLYLHTED